ncbi:c-type cytochrome [Falsiroseomonas bella]|nr:cytochrome c [Falsiroseomonas bella]
MRMLLMSFALSLAAGAALAQPFGDPAAGRRLAEARCSACHAIGPGASGRSIPGVPAFADVAAMPSTTQLALQAFLRQPHPPMPDIVLTPAELDNVIAYILSLRGEPRR